MKQFRLILSLGVMSTLVLSACAKQNAPQTGSMPVITGEVSTAVSGGVSGEVTPLPPTETIEPVPGAQNVVTLADQNTTLTLNVGENFLLNLGDMYTWEVNVSDPNVLSRVRNITVIKGAQGVYEALQAGTTSLQASGDPLCRQSQPPCGVPSLLFEMTVIVK